MVCHFQSTQKGFTKQRHVAHATNRIVLFLSVFALRHPQNTGKLAI